MTQSKKTPELFVEKLVQGELDEAAERQVRHKLAEEGGEARIDALKKSNEDILKAYAPAQLAASIRARHDLERQRRRKLSLMVMLPVSAAIATAAVLMFIVMPMAPTDGPFGDSGTMDARTMNDWSEGGSEGYVGRKGTGEPMLHLGKRTTDGQAWLKSGDKVNQGDDLQIKYNAGDAKSLVICSVDGRGAVSLHFPESESASTRVKPQSAYALPYAYTLDDAPDFERFILVWSESDAAVSVEEVLGAVQEMSESQTDTPTLRPSLKFKDITLKK